MTEHVRLHPDDCEAIAQRVAELLRGERASVDPLQRLTAAEVALRFGVSREWVYEHKAELGAITMGGGKRPRLRFDPQRVADALEAAPAAPAAVPVEPARLRRTAAREPGGGAPLLPYEGFEA